jgi:hypothetical protein
MIGNIIRGSKQNGLGGVNKCSVLSSQSGDVRMMMMSWPLVIISYLVIVVFWVQRKGRETVKTSRFHRLKLHSISIRPRRFIVLNMGVLSSMTGNADPMAA